jgi:hypothetical protein
MYDDGRWEGYADTFQEGDQEWVGFKPPAPDLLEPKRGFGKIWRSLGGPQARIGWATAPERGFPATIREYPDRLELVNDQGMTYILHANGTYESREVR